MAKKKKSIELSDKKITFNIEKRYFKAIRYYPTSMHLDVMEFDENKNKVWKKKIEIKDNLFQSQVSTIRKKL